jgi:hypothetical protein
VAAAARADRTRRARRASADVAHMQAAVLQLSDRVQALQDGRPDLLWATAAQRPFSTLEARYSH